MGFDRDYFTAEDNRTLNEMMMRYQQLQREQQEAERQHRERQEQEQYEQAQYEAAQAENNDYSRQQAIAELAAATVFLSNVREALDFTKASTMEIMEDGKDTYDLKCVSLYSNATEYAKATAFLTGGFNKEFRQAVEKTRTEPFFSAIMTQDEYKSSTKTALNNDKVKIYIDRIVEDNDLMNSVTVAEVLDVVDHTKDLRQKYHISNENIIDDTLYAFAEQSELGKIHTLTAERYSWETADRIENISGREAAEMRMNGFRSDDKDIIWNIMQNYAVTKNEAEAYCVVLEQFEKEGITPNALKSAEKDLAEKEIPVVIMESSDGYAMNPPERTPENAAVYDQRLKADGMNIAVRKDESQKTEVVTSTNQVRDNNTRVIEAGEDIRYTKEVKGGTKNTVTAKQEMRMTPNASDYDDR